MKKLPIIIVCLPLIAALICCGKWSAMTNQEVVAAIEYCKSHDMNFVLSYATFNFTDIFGVTCTPKRAKPDND